MGMKLKAIERNVSFDKNKTRYAFVLTPELYGKTYCRQGNQRKLLSVPDCQRVW